MDGDNGIEAKLNYPYGIDVDSNGDVYIAAGSLNTVVKYYHITKKIHLISGSPVGTKGFTNNVTAVDALMSWPGGVAVLPSGKKIIVSEWDSCTIRIVKNDKIISVAGDNKICRFQDGIGFNAYLDSPSFIARNHETGVILV